MSPGKLSIELANKKTEAAKALADHPTIGLIHTDDDPDVATLQGSEMSGTDALLVWLATHTGKMRPVLRADLDDLHAVSWNYVGNVMQAMCVNLDELDLSVRTANSLQNAECRFLVQLVVKTEADLLKTKNFGRKSLNEIKEVLAELEEERDLPKYTLSLGQSMDNPNIRAALAHLGLHSAE
ncbi:hypothetical protein HQ524_02315 [Candidatus Uhrbacteria bacterium]|nr:hypothetical protein [Candidatus Uhrbacteria bacterium]